MFAPNGKRTKVLTQMIRFFILLVFVFIIADVQGQAYLYATPFSVLIGEGPGQQTTIGAIGKMNRFAFATGFKVDSENTYETRKRESVTMQFGVGGIAGDFTFYTNLGLVYFKGQIGLIKGIQINHMLQVTKTTFILSNIELNTTRFYDNQFGVSIGYAWRM